MTSEQIIIGLIVAAAIALSIMLLSRRMSGKGGCGCSKTTCPSADTCPPSPDAQQADSEAAAETKEGPS